ncbi:gamma-interferon-responsive lysosomal thiol protein-like isoform X2 [Pistacia vera]|uniref:gamma-interferon-responsive lysosomal thiol protein-like isoform X2 n=1 Tax=Pistacia vera TaxID=55513 RepID=UPI00126399D4|nr:gamma-interferon-responsive lysosomal thiol protein-like isoform X2 [Pistacia vera]
MASKKQFIFLLIASVLLLLVSPSCGQNVTLSVYYETLCPYCADFIVNHLVKLFQNGIISIVNLRLIPWGNAFIQPDGTVMCQHGPGECLLNTIEACTISIYPDVHFSFIHCVERLLLEKRQAEWMDCFKITRLGNVPIDCYRNGNGKLLEQKYATETAQLNPPHRFVPWVVVNDQSLQEDYMNFVSYLCRAYKGTQVPEACRSFPLRTSVLEKADTTSSVCYAGEVKS